MIRLPLPLFSGPAAFRMKDEGGKAPPAPVSYIKCPRLRLGAEVQPCGRAHLGKLEEVAADTPPLIRRQYQQLRDGAEKYPSERTRRQPASRPLSQAVMFNVFARAARVFSVS